MDSHKEEDMAAARTPSFEGSCKEGLAFLRQKRCDQNFDWSLPTDHNLASAIDLVN